MGISRELKKSLRSFAEVMVQDSDAKADLRFGPWIGIPKKLRTEAEAAGFDAGTMLAFTRDEAKVINQTRWLMRRDPALDHLAAKDTKELLEELAWRLTIEHTKNRNPATRQTITREFIDRLEEPVQTYSVLFPIEWLKLPDEPWNLGSVILKQTTQADLDTWFPDNRYDHLPKDSVPVEGITIAVAEIVAGSPAIAAKRASGLVDEALDVLRLSVAQFGFRIWDNQMRCRRKDWYFTKRNGDHRATYASANFRGRLHDLELQADALREFSQKNLEQLQAPWSRTSPQGLSRDLIRSMRWVGKSIVNSDMDDKVIGLCTALECLLSTESYGLKSNEIAWRSMTLGELSGEGFTHPATIIRLYKARSDVVHGSAFGVCTEADYRILLNSTIDVLFQILGLIANDSTVTSKTKLFAVLDAPDHLKKCVEWCEDTDAKGFGSLIASMKKRIGEQEN